MLKKITVKAGLIALLSLMTLLLIVVSIIGVKAINDGTRSLQTLNQILGKNWVRWPTAPTWRYGPERRPRSQYANARLVR